MKNLFENTLFIDFIKNTNSIIKEKNNADIISVSILFNKKSFYLFPKWYKKTNFNHLTMDDAFNYITKCHLRLDGEIKYEINTDTLNEIKTMIGWH